MIRDIEEEVAATAGYLRKTALEPEVMAVIKKVQRHLFVPQVSRREAYENRPQSIGHGQTISQPYIVAVMTDLLEPKPDHRILEIGTGSGYQAAILAELVAEVYSVEVIPELGEVAAARLKQLGYDNVHVKIGDGYYGWEEHAPYDGIIVTAAGPGTPQPLVDQLKPGGKLVIPVGEQYSRQELLVISKQASGEVDVRKVLPVAFVPLTGDH
jgi:protein-L-isoaspartate(D-aspartate) O-methyltransferase